jgi:hypothetical protein
LRHLETHWVLTLVVEGQLLTVDVAQQTGLEVVERTLDSHWHLDTLRLER